MHQARESERPGMRHRATMPIVVLANFGRQLDSPADF